jgi:peptidyl-prolyl cis-trans isomerase C
MPKGRSMSTWSREPLLHFAVLGAAIFVLHAWTVRAPSVDTRQVIEVPAEQVDRLANVWRRQWQRPPSRHELRAVIDGYVREEVLYRRALALGLDKNDSMIRQRLAQKVQFLSEDIAELAEPDEATLRRFFEERAGAYVTPETLSFTHVYFSRGRRNGAAEADAKRALETLARDPAAAELGDPFVLPFTFTRASAADVASQLGEGFAAAMRDFSVGTWEGPVASSYGVHLVRVSERTEGRRPDLSEVRSQVLQDYRHAQRDEANRALIEGLRAGYRVVVDEPAIAAAVGEAVARADR